MKALIVNIKHKIASLLLGPDVIYIGRSITIDGLSIAKAKDNTVTVVNYGTIEVDYNE